MNLKQAQENVNTAFEALAHHRRRYALRCLKARGTAMAPGELADEVAERANETLLEDLPAEKRARVYLSLSHTHLPKLAEDGFVQYDQGQGAVSLEERNEHVEKHQELLTVE